MLKQIKFYDWLSICVTLATIFIVFYAPYRIDADNAWYIHSARQALQGREAYLALLQVTIAEFLVYLSMIPYGLSELTGAPVTITFGLMISAFSIFSVVTTRVLLGEYIFKGEHTVLSSVIPFILVLLTLHYKLTQHYGQREHIFAILYMPGFFLRYARWQGNEIPRSFAIIVGIMAGIGCLMKLPFLTIILLPELYWLIANRRIKPLFSAEVWALAVTILLYMLHIYFVFPLQATGIYRGAFSNVSTYYEYFGRKPLSEMIFTANTLLIVGFVITGCFLAFFAPQKTWKQITVGISSFTVGTLALYVIQSRGLGYHILPSIYGTGILLALLLYYLGAYRLRIRRLKKSVIHIILLACFLMLAIDLRAFWDQHKRLQVSVSQFQYVLSQAAEYDSEVVYLGMHQFRYTDLTVLGLWHINHNSIAYPVIFRLLIAEANNENITIENVRDESVNQYLQQIANDIEQYSPTLLIIGSRPGDCVIFCKMGYYSLYDIAVQNEELEHLIEEQYHYFGDADGHFVYVRNDANEKE